MKIRRTVCTIIMVICSISLLFATGSENLTFRFFDFPELGKLGQKWGDCTLITFPNGEVMLLDSGISGVSSYLVQNLKELGITRIDKMILSHVHSDHYGGLRSVLNNFPIGDFYWNGFCSTNETWVIDLLKNHNVPIHLISAGDVIEIGDVTIKVLYPSRQQLDSLPVQDSDAAMINMNNNSLCLRFEHGDNSALFCGDLYKVAENAVIESVPPQILDCDLLKVNHHGHDTSSSKAWVQATSPKAAVMMGNIVMNLVLYKRFVDVGCTPLATWMNGTILVEMDGTTIDVTAENPEINEYYRKLIK